MSPFSLYILMMIAGALFLYVLYVGRASIAEGARAVATGVTGSA